MVSYRKHLGVTRHIILALFLMPIFSSTQTYAGAAVLKVLTYNIAGLPFKQQNGGRFKRIGKILEERRHLGTEPDLVLLQEVFIKKSRKVIEYANYPYLFKGPKALLFKGKLFSSGLYVLSNHPFLETNKESFRGRKNCTSWDCFANKGVTHSRIKVKGIPFPIEIMTTHMQANAGGTAKKVSRSRKKQIKIVKSFMAEHIDSNLPLIFAGDFNLKPDHPKKPHYPLLLSTTGGINSGEHCLINPGLCFIDPETPLQEVWTDSNDHHIFRAPQSIIVEPIYLTRNFQEILDGDNLSDHLGYEVHYRITW